MAKQFHGNFRSKTPVCWKIRYVFRDVKWCFNGSWGPKGLTNTGSTSRIICFKTIKWHWIWQNVMIQNNKMTLNLTKCYDLKIKNGNEFDKMFWSKNTKWQWIWQNVMIQNNKMTLKLTKCYVSKLQNDNKFQKCAVVQNKKKKIGTEIDKLLCFKKKKKKNVTKYYVPR